MVRLFRVRINFIKLRNRTLAIFACVLVYYSVFVKASSPLVVAGGFVKFSSQVEV